MARTKKTPAPKMERDEGVVFDENARCYTIAKNGFEIHATGATVVHRNLHSGRTYVTTSDFNVYNEVPLFNVLTGKYHRLWLTREQTETYRVYEVQESYPPPDPKLFEIHKVGFIEKFVERQKAHKKKLFKEGKLNEDEVVEEIDNPDKRAFLEAHIHPGHLMSVSLDNEGNLWVGDIDQPMLRPYTVMEYSVPEGMLGDRKFEHPVLRFMWPYLDFLGPLEGVEDPDTGEKGHWHVEKWGRRDSSRTRLIISTYEVSKVIEDAKVWGFYFPLGEAMTDPDVARAECEALRASMLQHIVNDTEQWKLKVEELENRLDEAEAYGHQMREENRALTKANEELQAAHAEMAQELALLKQRRSVRRFDPLWEEQEGEAT